MGPAACVVFLLDKVVTTQYSVQTLGLSSVTIVPYMVHTGIVFYLPPTLCNIILLLTVSLNKTYKEKNEFAHSAE
jgi:hypothetical protein